MINRSASALAATLLLVGSTLAQSPPGGAPHGPPAPTEGAGLPPTAIEGPPMPLTPTCGDGACCDAAVRTWATADYLMSWIRSASLPPLVTTSPAGTDRTLAGVAGQQTTSSLFGGQVNDEVRSGFRFELGAAFGPDHNFGVEAGVMLLESQATLFGASSTGTPILARPYFDAVMGSPQAQLIAFPGAASGSVDVRATSGNFYEAHFDFSEKVIDDHGLRVDALLGYRFYRFDEGLRIRGTVNPTDPNFAAGTQIVTTDSFGTHNEFHGLDLGVRTQFVWDKLSVGLLAKLAVGNVQHQVAISGSQTTTVPGVAPVTQSGGLLALASNSGTFGAHDWEILPELGVNVGWQVTSYLSVRVGYSILWLNDLARPGDQIDTVVNPALFPPAQAGATPTRPAFQIVTHDTWVQSLSLGVGFTY